MNQYTQFSFPLGFINFNTDSSFNFQLNRLYSLGIAPLKELQRISSRIKNYNDWKREMVFAAEQSISEKELLTAAYYYRMAEFYLLPSDTDKDKYYKIFIELFDDALGNDSFRRYNITYEDASLPVLRLTPDNVRGKIIIHGGYDSLMEEYYSIASYFVHAGYDVFLFDGPGQGGALRNSNLTLISEWEKPVKAVLDYFNMEDITIIGISLGGNLALRASVFESRISRYVAWNHFYDWKEFTNSKRDLITNLVYGFLMIRRASKTINQMVEQGIDENASVACLIKQGMHITGTPSPYQFLTHMNRFSSKKISSKVKQDVLLLAGTEDHSQPLKLFYKQKKALINAKSVSVRIFSKEENAQNHCQIGNIKLALDVIREWIDEKSE